MTRDEAKARLAFLAKEIARHDHLYYNMARPELTDSEYDRLRQENAELEALYPDLIRADSPSWRVGAALQGQFEKVVHKEPLLSLDNAFSEEDVVEFLEKIGRFFNRPLSTELLFEDFPLWAEPKIDGLTASLTYQNGILISGATRGDGITGQDVTQNIKTILDIPLHLPEEISEECPEYFNGFCNIRGEVYMTKQVFHELNKNRGKEGAALFANPRNAAAGSLNQLDVAITRQRKLRFFAYEIVASTPLLRQTDVIQRLNQLHFHTTGGKLCRSLEDVMQYYQDMEKRRKLLPYDIDGVVYKLNDRLLQERLGNVGRVPRHSIAHKFPAEQATTRVLEIRLQMGRSGVLTPVAILAPVVVGGATIQRATLHNENEINRLDVRQGDWVLLQRAGDVIPQIVRVLKEKRTDSLPPFQMPKFCPFCGNILHPSEEGTFVHCFAGFQCPEQEKERLIHFCSREAFNIEGLGEKNIDFLYKTKRILKFADIFTLQQRNEALKNRTAMGELFPSPAIQEKETLIPKSSEMKRLEQEDGWGELSVKNLWKAIHASKNISSERFLYALGLPQVGKQTAVVLLKHFKTVHAFFKASKEELLQLDGIGEKMAEDICQSLRQHDFRERIDDVLRYVTPIPFEERGTGTLAGKTVVFTGKFTKFTRAEAKAQAVRLGAKVGSEVTTKTHWVVIGKDSGRKSIKAKELGLRILTEDEWLSQIVS